MHVDTKPTRTFHKLLVYGFTICLGGLLSIGIASAQQMEQGLILHYSFDATNNSKIPDVSGHSKEGIIYGSATLVEGYSGRALEFPGLNDYLLLPDNINADLEDFSIAVWVKGNASWNTWSRIFDFGRGTSYNMFLTPVGGNGVTRFAIKNGGSEQIIDASSLLPWGEWVHICLTVKYTRGVGVGILYINGTESGRNDNISITPAMLSLDAETNQNYLAKSQYNDPELNAALDDFRIYNRVLSEIEIAVLNGIPLELVQQHQALDLGDLSKISQDLDLPLSIGNQGVVISWSSSHPNIISDQGLVQRPEYFNIGVNLTATLSLNKDNKTHKLDKVFYATVLALKVPEDLIARWNFDTKNIQVNPEEIKVLDASSNGFLGSCMNKAKLITIGEQTRYNVLSLGKSNGYFDMGTEIGTAIYSLEDYSIGVFFRVDEDYTNLSAYGNWVWNFSNSDHLGTEANGALWGALRSQQQTICKTHYGTEQTVQLGYPAKQGEWHHMGATYNQASKTAILYIDGSAVATNTQVNQSCTNSLRLSGRNGTLYNWLGRSCYTGDAFLAQTLLYDFQLHRVTLSQAELNQHFDILATIEALNTAYKQNPDYHNPHLLSEFNNLQLEGIDALEQDLMLPAEGQIDADIKINWTSSHPAVISDQGLVNRPDYVDFIVHLTATLQSGADYLQKHFRVVVKANEGTSYQGNLLLHHDFSQLKDSLLTDQAEKQFEASLKGGAGIIEIGLDNHRFRVLDLGLEGGYVDLGQEIGKIIFSLSDFSVACFYRINKDYADLTWNGNSLWSFSNSEDIYTEPQGYMSAFLNNQGYYISGDNWSNEHSLCTGKPADQDAWHHLTYTQHNQIGSLYLDGILVRKADIPAQPFEVLQKKGLSGTSCNWLGRSAYKGDVYLQNTLIYDFRVYNKALEPWEISDSLLNVPALLSMLDLAYNQSYPAANKLENMQHVAFYYSNNQLFISGITSGDLIRLIPLTGSGLKQYQAVDQQLIIHDAELQPGLFLLQVFRKDRCILTSKIIIPNHAL